jgi:hypothetical protein
VLQAVGQAIEGHFFSLSVLACPTALQRATQKEGGTAVDLWRCSGKGYDLIFVIGGESG